MLRIGLEAGFAGPLASTDAGHGLDRECISPNQV